MRFCQQVSSRWHPRPGCRMGDKAVAWPVCRCWVPDTTATWLGVPFLQFIAHTNPSSRQLQGTLACAMICRKAMFTISFSEVMLPDANFLSSRAQNGSSSNFVLSSYASLEDFNPKESVRSATIHTSLDTFHLVIQTLNQSIAY